jgi:hypothetical protein
MKVLVKKISWPLSVRNSQGMSLLQTLIALAISAIVILGVTSFLADSYKHTASLSQNLDRDALLGELRVALASSETCNSLSFVGQVFAQEEMKFSELKQGTVVLLSQSTGYSGLEVHELRLKKRGPSLLSKAGVNPGETLKLVPVSLTVDLGKKVSSSIAFREKPINFYIYLDNADRVHSCFGGFEYSQAQQTCELLLGGTYNVNPGPNKPNCLLKPAVRDYEKIGVRTTKAYAGTMSFIGGTGKVISWGAFNEYEMVAPDCPAQTIPTGCRIYMRTQMGQDQTFNVMSFDIDGGDPLAPSNTIPVSWRLSYFDDANLDGEGRSRCTMRIANPTANGTWTEYFPRVSCSAQSEVFLPK